MELTEAQVKHIAHLARLKLSDEEVKKFTTQLISILDWVSMLDEVDTTNVVPTSQITGLKNVLREDKIVPSTVSREELLGCTELPIENKQIKVKPVL